MSQTQRITPNSRMLNDQCMHKCRPKARKKFEGSESGVGSVSDW